MVTICIFNIIYEKKLRGKIIYSERGDPGDSEYKGILKIIRKISFKFIDNFVFQSEGARDYFSKKTFDKSIVIHNSVSVDENKFCFPCSNRQKRIISVGRLHPQKNQILLIKAFEYVCEEFKDYTLDIYGDGPLKIELEKYIKSKELAERIHIRVSIKNIFDIVYSSSLFVLTSNYEGMPNALLEAMSLGVPSISTDYSHGGSFDKIIS